MRHLLLIFLLLYTLHGNELILLSSDPAHLSKLYQQYKQKLLVDTTKIYLIPTACILDRYFGGASQGDLILVDAPIHTDELLPTQAVFEAKQTQEIQSQIDIQKQLALVQGSMAKEFIQDDEGRAYGGASEIPVDHSFQTPQHNDISQEDAPSHPSCILLEDGSGYELLNTTSPRFYDDKGFSDITDTIIYFD